MRIFITTLIAALFLFLQPAKAQLQVDWASYYGHWTASTGTLVMASAYDSKSGFVYVCGFTTDTSNIASLNGFKSQYSGFQQIDTQGVFGTGMSDAFLAKFDTLGNRIWATYYGGVHSDYASSVAVDTNGNVYIAGVTRSDTGIATPNGFASDNNENRLRPFLAKFNSNGQRLWGTYYGGHTTDTNNLTGYSAVVAVDRENNVYMAGSTYDELGISTPGSHQSVIYPTLYFNPVDAYLLKFNPDGVKIWGTYYGGASIEGFSSIYIDKYNDVYGVGATASIQNIASPGALLTVKPAPEGMSNAFIVKFNKLGQRLWATYVGGESGDNGFSVIGNKEGDAIYLNGFTNSTTGIATANAHQVSYAGYRDGFLMKYTANGNKLWGSYYGGTNLDFTFYFGGSGFSNSRNLAFDEKGNILWAGVTSSQTHMETHCVLNPNHRVSILSKWDTTGQLLWGTYYDASLSSITAIGNGDRFFVGGTTSYDSLATTNGFETTKVTNKPSGFMAMFKGDFTCPIRNFIISRSSDTLSIDSTYQYHYQWFLNNQAIANSDTFRILIADTAVGTYFVKITDTCDCVYTSKTLDLAHTAIQPQQENSLYLDIFPNPNSGKFNIKGHLKTLQTVSYSITDISGKELGSGKLPSKSQKFDETLDCTYLKAGIYFIKLKQGQDWEIKKLIIF